MSEIENLLHEKDFNVENYEDFYEHHYFQPVDDEDATNAQAIFPRVAWALDIAKEVKPKRILDLGCLEGYAVLTLANHVESVKEGVGVDLSEKAISIARQHAYKNRLAVTFVQGTLEKFLETTKEKFDFVMLFEVMEHVKDPEGVIELVDKVLAPNGTVLISTPAFESPTFGKTDTINKCHVRLYTTKDEDYSETFVDLQPESDTHGQKITRKATSITKQIGKNRIKSIDIFSELIHVRYQ